jgi:alpha-beta hydrolase superfamily lysophospholipase
MKWLLAFCIISASGCARVYLTVTPTPVSHNLILRRNDVNGVSTWAILPESYNAQTATPWVIYDHGIGQTINSITADPPQSAFVQSLATAGFVVIASEYRNLACWGNMDCVEDIANLQTLWRSQLNLWSQPFVIGESMGGIVTWNAIAHGVLKPLAAVGVYPACNLANMYSRKVFVPTIQTAYGFTSRSGYSAATRGFDPMLDPPSIFADIPILIWASRSDTVVKRSQNEDPFANAINAAGGSVTINTSRGQHGDPSNFDAPAVISFFSLHLQ